MLKLQISLCLSLVWIASTPLQGLLYAPYYNFKLELFFS
jgi:hypothetical protein